MGIAQFDTFSVSWNISRETEFSYRTELIIECYESSESFGNQPIMAIMSNLKSVAKIAFGRGDAYTKQNQWEMAIIAGEQNMREFVRSIMKVSLPLSPWEIDEAIEKIDQALEEGLIPNFFDPRLN